jgi:hypothetical protein
MKSKAQSSFGLLYIQRFVQKNQSLARYMKMNATMDPTLQKLETEFQQLVGPYINDPMLLQQHRDRSTALEWSPLDHLEYVFHVNLQMLIHLHTLPEADPDVQRSPSLQGWFLLITGYFTKKLNRQMADYRPGYLERERELSWLKEHFNEWNEKLAGLHFLPRGWRDRALDHDHPALGILSGTDWLRVLYLFTRYHRRHLDNVKKDS